jgi:hypothetical protein
MKMGQLAKWQLAGENQNAEGNLSLSTKNPT